jgi:hypothetical protein
MFFTTITLPERKRQHHESNPAAETMPDKDDKE